MIKAGIASWLMIMNGFAFTSPFGKQPDAGYDAIIRFLFAIQVVSYLAKICIHPQPIRSLDELWQHAAIGPLPGQIVLTMGFVFQACLVLLAVLTLKGQQAAGRVESMPAKYV